MTPEEVLKLFGAKDVKPPPPKKSPEEWAKIFGPGVRIVGRVPHGGGPLGAAHLAHIYQQRMAQVRAEEEALQALGLSEATVRKLSEIAKKTSTSEHPVSPRQIAKQMVEDAVANHREAV